MAQETLQQPNTHRSVGKNKRRVMLALMAVAAVACSSDKDSASTLGPDQPTVPTTAVESAPTLAPETTVPVVTAAPETVATTALATVLETTTIPLTVATTVPATTQPQPETTVAQISSSTSVPACEFGHDTLPAQENYNTVNGVRLSALYGDDVDLGDHDGSKDCPKFERFVFRTASQPDSQAPSPGWRVRYVDAPVTNDPSGEPEDIEGNAFLQIVIGSWMYGPEGGDGTKRVSDPAMELIQEAVLTGNFESITTWTLGLDQRRNFLVREIPATEDVPYFRIYIDVGDDLPAK